MRNITTDPVMEYPVTVDHGKTIEEMVAAGQYRKVHEDINSRNFPIRNDGKVERCRLEIVHFNCATTIGAVDYYLDLRIMRPATLAELLAFGAAYPEIRPVFPIIAVGSIWDGYGTWIVPHLDSGGLGTGCGNSKWSEFCRFLAVRR